MRHALLALLTVFAAGCGKSEPLTFTTYNAGLAVAFVPSANERAPVVADAVAKLESDVICLQEVWLPEHVAMFESAAKGSFEHTYFPDAQQTQMTAPACAPGELDSLVECLGVDCGAVCDDELVDCLFDSCPLDFFQLSKTCSMCVQAHVGTAEADEVEATCTAGGIEYAYGGSFGTGFLSKHPIKVDEEVFFSTTNRRSVLHAVIETPDGDVDAWCTHLTAGLSLIPYPREEGSWETEQADQAALLADFLKDAPDPVVLMGDLNNGPATKDADEEFLANYETILGAGLTSPFVDEDGACTFCPENLLSSVDSDETGKLIDHVMIRGFEEKELSVKRELDKSLTVESCGVDGPGNYSDHFGVSVTITQ